MSGSAITGAPKWMMFYERAQQFGAFGGVSIANIAREPAKAAPSPPALRRNYAPRAA